jgi:REP element-mobilizing transposase RayT
VGIIDAMTYNPEIHHRRSIRLRGYDYAGLGAYFVTICAHNRACLFGEIAEGNVRLNEAGHMVVQWWQELSQKFPSIEIDESIVMPNHVHGILAFIGAPLCGRPNPSNREQPGRSRRAAPTLGDVMTWLKTMTTNAYIRGVKDSGWNPFEGTLWQRNYYEHIIRDEHSLDALRRYIVDNPAKWPDDENHPDHLRNGGNVREAAR